MSKYSFIVSNRSLPEVDLTGVVRMKYGEYKKLDIPSSGESLLDQLDEKDDNLEILILDSTKMNHLKITLCTNRPYDLEAYIQQEFIYWLEGSSDDAAWKEQLYEYLKGLKNMKDGLEIWSIWFGDGPQEIEKMKFKLSDLQLIDLEALKSMSMNYCIKFE
ncbi:hypothetical protein MH117_03880 [Paenibacillus sp. ACRRX]|uniref:hypothetical protein n=1 Tax=unclassified Paenibacillus TaxID=185978 RepID=UPI001EF6713F|nr:MULTISPECIES: hypothetical protein [unclassified Paenibacillus]MCG7406545.1 hypothetical protein [Paenibacillus sp. ACRRX]MDK8179578.1 hypothetical protein [Paenibacillus sp. UMB4589-SE434]